MHEADLKASETVCEKKLSEPIGQIEIKLPPKNTLI